MDVSALAALATQTLASRQHREGGVAISERLWLFTRQAPTAVRADLYDPVICLILQGAKQVSIGDQTHEIGPGQSLLVTHDMLVAARITRASAQTPYISLILGLDVGVIRSLYEEVSEVLDARAPARSTAVQSADAHLVSALSRMLSLSEDPVERRVIEPMLIREIHFRLLMAPQGGMLRELLRHDSHASSVARAIRRIRDDFRVSISVAELAREVGMSVSSFHKHFRDITSNTPLQYQKELRLLEARRLLSTGAHQVTAVAYDVGYGSPNQFSREYARKFGVPPIRHLGGAV